MATMTDERTVEPDGMTPGGPGVPVAVDPDVDLGTKGSSTPDFSDSIYINGELSAGDRRFGVLVHILWHGNGNRFESVSVVDEAVDRYQTGQLKVPVEDLVWAPAELDITTPRTRWLGDSRHQTLRVSWPWCELDLDLAAQGPVLYYGGTGTYRLLGEQQWQYALPQLHTTGTLTIGGRTYEVAGNLWLDRQWGLHPDLPGHLDLNEHQCRQR